MGINSSAGEKDECKTKAQLTAELAERLPQICAGIAGGLAVLALIGWLVNVRLLAGQWGTYVPMAPSTALALLLLSGALLICAHVPDQRSRRILALAATSLVSLLGLLVLAQFIAGIDLGVGHILSDTNELLGDIPVDRMAPLTAFSFLLAGAAILILLSPSRWRHDATTPTLFAAGATAINLIVLVGYAFGAPLLYGGQIVPTAFTSAAAFVALGIGLLQMTLRQSPRLRSWSHTSLKGRLLRAFAPFLIGFILIQDWLQIRLEVVAGRNLSLYAALSAMVGVSLMTILIAWVARRTGKAEEESQAQIVSLARFLDEDPSPVLRFTRDGRLICANRNSQHLLEYWHTETTGESLPEAEHQRIAETLVRGVSQQVEVTCGEIAYSLLLVPVMEMDYVNIYGRDITERKWAEETLRELNTVLEQRVADRTRQLADANAQLTELDRLKDEFVARISHELYTPLVNIKLYLGLLEHGKPDKHDQYMETLHHEAARLQQLIEDLLRISLLELDAARLQLVPVDVNQLLAQLVIDRSGLARERGLRIESQPAADLPRAAADSTLLMQALSNLMTNALNYTPAGGTLTLSTALQSGGDQAWVTCTVRDTGLGISAKDRPRIFERFYRGEAAKDYTLPGTGLGLSISKEIVEKMGGRITVESEPGHGAVFTVWLKSAD